MWKDFKRRLTGEQEGTVQGGGGICRDLSQNYFRDNGSGLRNEKSKHQLKPDKITEFSKFLELIHWVKCLLPDIWTTDIIAQDFFYFKIISKKVAAGNFSY